MIRFIVPTDGVYDEGTQWEFAPAIEDAYVGRRVAVYVEKEADAKGEEPGTFEKSRQDKMFRRDRAKTKA
jgi:hypothetical protein